MLKGDEILVREGVFELPADERGRVRLFLGKCSSCGEYTFPPKKWCPMCDTNEIMQKITSSGKGKLYSYTVVKASTPEFKIPYIVGVVKLAEGPLIISHIHECEEADCQIGMDLEVSAGQVSTKEGKKVISYVFKPVRR